jgi:nucleotide-binding universal stress UspA family protein
MVPILPLHRVGDAERAHRDAGTPLDCGCRKRAVVARGVLRGPSNASPVFLKENTVSVSTRILCAVDFSRPAQAAFEHALALSRARNAELTAVHAVPVSERFNWRARERIAKTEALRAAADAAGVRLRVTEQHGDPAGVILLHANAGRFDLIVLGTHARTGVERLRAGSIAEQVTKRASCPVLIVPMSEARREGLASFRNIMCPVDFTKASDAALGHALHLVKDGGRLTLLHVSKASHAVSASRYAYHFSVPEYARRLQQDAWQRLQDVVPVEARTTADVRARVVSGTPATEIVRIASEIEADLIVMGVTSRGAIGRKLIGSTAARVIRTAGRPVLAVPEGVFGRLNLDTTPDSVTRLAA